MLAALFLTLFAGNVTATLSIDGTELVVVGSPQADSISFDRDGDEHAKALENKT